MHPELYLTLHQQQQRELDRALAVAVLVRERTTPAAARRGLRARALVQDVATAGRSFVRGLRAPAALTADRSPAACCAA